jgi:hypothetical protein
MRARERLEAGKRRKRGSGPVSLKYQIDLGSPVLKEMVGKTVTVENLFLGGRYEVIAYEAEQ